jgi:rubrerythrin
LNYRKETGRGFEDFIKLKEDFDAMTPDDVLRSYLKATQDGLDDDDIDVMMEDYSYNEDLDDDSTIRRAKLSKKKMVAEAKQYFNSQKEKYKTPLESSTANVSPEEKEELQAYKQYISQAKTMDQEAERKREWFSKKTDEVFNNEFKGFEFKLDDQVLRFTPGDAAELKKAQLTPTNFISKYLDKDGMINDATGYHRALAVAMNPEKFAKYFYEQGRSAATDDVTRRIKNINMSERQSPQPMASDGFQVKVVDPDAGKGLKIRSIKKI